MNTRKQHVEYAKSVKNVGHDTVYNPHDFPTGLAEFAFLNVGELEYPSLSVKYRRRLGAHEIYRISATKEDWKKLRRVYHQYNGDMLGL